MLERITKNTNACLENLLSDLDALEAIVTNTKRKRKAGPSDSLVKKRKSGKKLPSNPVDLAKSFLIDEAEGNFLG